MKKSVMLASCVLLGVVALAMAQQPSPNTSASAAAPAPVQKRKPQQGNQARGQPQPKPRPAPGIRQPSPRKIPPGSSATHLAPPNNFPPYSQALRRHRHDRHDRSWWHRHYTVIVLCLDGYYYWDAGYWFPAWGYSPVYQYYDYDGPIYAWGNLLPDQAITLVQRALKELGYYNGIISGALTPSTRTAIAAFQEDNGLEITGVIDAATVSALGLD